MTENIGLRIGVPFMECSNPELLHLASYLARHDVAFNNLPQYPTESPEHEEAEPIIKVRSRREVSNRLPPRIHLQPVKGTSLGNPQRKPIHIPTERRLSAARVSQLKQLINKSKAALVNLDSEISAERADVDLHIPSNESKKYVRCHRPKRAVTPSGVLKPCVRILGDKGAPKEKQSVLERRVSETVGAYRRTPQHSARSRTHDTNLLSSYLKRLALGSSFGKRVEDLQSSYLPQSCKSFKVESLRLDTIPGFRSRKDSQYQRKCPPELGAFLKKWGESLKIRDPDEAKGIRILSPRGCLYDSISNSSSASTDSIGKFIRNHTKQQLSHQSQTLRSTEVESIRHKSPKRYRPKCFPRVLSVPKAKALPTGNNSITSSYQTLRLPVEQYRRLLTSSRTTEAVHEERWRRGNFPSSATSLSRLCDWLAKEIVDCSVEAVADFIDHLSSDVINELFRQELVVSSSSPWQSFSNLAWSPQLRQTSLQRLFMPIPSEAPVELNQQEVAPGESFLIQESEQRENPTPKKANYCTTKPVKVPYTQPSGRDCVVTQEARTPVLQQPICQSENALSPIEEVPTVSFPTSKAKPGSFPVRAVESALESTCINESPHTYAMGNECTRKSTGDAASSPDRCTCAEVIEGNAIINHSIGASSQKNMESLSTPEGVRAQKAGSTICPPQLIHTGTIANISSNAKISIPIECRTPSDTSSNSRNRLELSESLHVRGSSVYMDDDYDNSLSGTKVLAQITADGESSCNKHVKSCNTATESESSLKESSLGPQRRCNRTPASYNQEMCVFPRELNALQSTQDDCSVMLPITFEGLSSPKPVKLHQNPHSLDLVSSLTDASVPDISTPDVAISMNNETLQPKSLPVSDATASVIKGYGNYEEDFESIEESN